MGRSEKMDLSTAGGGTGDTDAGTSKTAKAKATKQLLQDFLAEYAKSGAAKCRKCEEKILKVCFQMKTCR